MGDIRGRRHNEISKEMSKARRPPLDLVPCSELSRRYWERMAPLRRSSDEGSMIVIDCYFYRFPVSAKELEFYGIPQVNPRCKCNKCTCLTVPVSQLSV